MLLTFEKIAHKSSSWRMRYRLRQYLSGVAEVFRPSAHDNTMTLPTVFASAARPLAHSVGRRRSLRVVDAFFGSFTALFLLLVPLSVQAAAPAARFTRISVEQ